MTVAHPSAALSLAAVQGAASGIEKAGVVALVALVALVLVARPARLPARVRAWAMLATLVLAPVVLAVDIWNTSPLEHLRRHPALAAAACLVGIALVLALAFLFRRRPTAVALASIAALPFRVPIDSGGSTANLLVPLYVVVAAGTLAYVARDLVFPRAAHPVGAADGNAVGGTAPDGTAAAARDRRRGVQAPARRPATGMARVWSALTSPRAVESILAATIALYGLQSLYSSDFSKALQNVAFFYAPFALLFVLLADMRWTRALLLRCFGIALALAIVFAGVGFIEYERQRLFLNPKLVAANEYATYFRVNSVFFDPNIYGRFLALVMLLVVVALLRAATRRQALAAAAVLLWLWAGLLTSFSESSMAALLLGLAILAAWRWDVLTTAYVAVAAIVIAIAVVLAAPPSAHFGLSGEGGSANNATSGRVSLVTGGLALFADRPLTGFGSGSFAREYRSHHRSSQQVAVSASHTIPITVAAEQGLLGLALYVLLIVAAIVALFRGAGRSPPRIAIAACFVALILHTWTYADFLEDPTTWALLAVGLALASRRASPAGASGEAGAGGEMGAAGPAAMTRG